MTLPANVRVNASLNFPSLTIGSGPITVTKNNGVWTVGFNMGNLGATIPAPIDYPNTYLVIYNSILKVHSIISLSNFPIFPGPSAAPKQRSITGTPVTIAASDQILNLNLSAPATITLPTAASRVGFALVFKDVGKKATANPITIAAAGGDTIDGFASVSLNVNGQSMTLVPGNDSVNITLWSLE